eukprot:TRINITY_DN2888_c0_g1_i1.p1 TRINITY_DN2888_c0_g1~~TRINITY_DN2888_c0_g1_i1.p1  ORF type:complete len:416 (-),score=54.13 TRINITY_DN2888_c0_g1_i1:49-1296(-)
MKANYSAISDYTPFYSKKAKRLAPNPIRSLVSLMKPGTISLGGGAPNQSLFPITTFSFKLGQDVELTLSPTELIDALQYSDTYGIPSLLSALKKLQIKFHKPTVTDWNILITTGSQDGIAKAFDILIDEEDYVIVENPIYSGSLSSMQMLNSRFVSIDTDENGIIPDVLSNTLKNWGETHPNCRLPKVMYVVPTGQNPSGSTLSQDRRKKVYSIAQEYNLIILEDDPYWHLRLLPHQDKDLQSFFSLDVDGRVLRFDSFSKIISSGMRLGWVTGPTPLIEKLQLNQQATCLHVSEHWGENGLASHIQKIQEFYTKQRDACLRACNNHLKGLVEWNVPTAGMFLWFKLSGIEDSEPLIKEKAVAEKVLFLSGKAFDPFGRKSPFVRASYSTATEEEMDEAMKRLSRILKGDQQNIN